MKQHWQRLQQKIDALTLRERALAFAAAAFILVTLINTMLLDPLFSQQKQLSERVKQEQQQLTALQSEIQMRVKANDIDPDVHNRERLRRLKEQLGQTNSDLMAMQKGLVSPDKMAGLLDDLLKRNGRLQLVSLKTLPVTTLSESTHSDSKPNNAVTSPQSSNSKNDTGKELADGIVYKHSVEIVVQGSYGDMVNYLTQLESMPWQLFWAGARLNADAYPKAVLTLNLFTLSLDKRWLNI